MFATARLLHGALEKSAAYVDLAGPIGRRVAAERRPGFDVLLAELRLVLARWHGDLETALETRPLLEAALAAQPAGEGALGDEIRCVALQNLGVAELWSSRLDDARRDLEQGLALARRAGRPWLEIPCLAHLGIAGPLTGLSLSAGLELEPGGDEDCRRARLGRGSGDRHRPGHGSAWRCSGWGDSMRPSNGSSARGARCVRAVNPAPS